VGPSDVGLADGDVLRTESAQNRTARRRRRRIGLIALMAVAAIALAACGDDDDGGGGGGGDGGGSGGGEDYRIAIMSVGAENDKSWSNANFDGAKEGAEEYGADLTVVPNLGTPEDYVQQGAAFARRGYDMVLMQHGAMTEPATQIATQFPDTKVGIVWDPTDEQRESLPENLFTWDPRQQDGGFLAGALAGLVTKSNVVAGITGAPFPAIIRQPEAFSLGARCVNPDVRVLIRYTGDVTFADAGLARGAAESVMGDGADVLFTALDGAVNGVIQAAKSKPNTYVIGQYFDQADKAPDVILTSVLHNLQGINKELVRMGVQDELKPSGHYEYTLANLDVGTLAGFGQLEDVVTPEIQKQLDEVEKKVRNGDIKVPDNEELAEEGSAENIDPADLGC